MADSHLATELLSRRFGALAAVDRVSLHVARGECHAVIGPNGAGKSTLLKLLSGELMPSSGLIRLRGQDVTRAPPDRIARLGVGRSYQTANLFAELSCEECVSLSAQARLDTSMRFFRPIEHYPEVAERANKALLRCGLIDRREQLSARLSYGEQRQLELGMILAGEPELLLLDEPLAGLGHKDAAQVVELLRGLSKDHTLLLVEHDMDAIFSLADAITVMVDGRILESGPPAQIKASSAVREAYLGEEQP